MKKFNTILNTLWFGIIPKISTLINILLLPILTPYLTKSDLGIWGVVSSYTSIVLAVYTLGLHVHFTNIYFEYKSRFNIYWGKLLSIIMFSSFLFSSLLFFLIIYSFNDIKFSQRIIIASIAILPVLFNCNSLIANHFYPLVSKPKPLVFRNLISSLFGLFVLFISVYIYKIGYLGFILSAATTSVIGFLLYIKPIWIDAKIFPRLDKNKKRVIDNLRISLPAIPHALGFILLSSSSKIIMTIFNVSLSDIGLYSMGTSFGENITIITIALVTSLVPKIQEKFRSLHFDDFRRLFYIVQSVAIISTIYFAIWLPEFFNLLVKNKQFKYSSEIALFVAFSNVLTPLYFFLSTSVFIEKKTIQILWLVFIPGFLNIILDFLFIPIWGYKVAIFSTLISYWSLIFIPFFVPYYKHVTSIWLGGVYKLIYLLLVVTLALILSYYLSFAPISLKIASSIIFFLLVSYYYIRNRQILSIMKI